MTTTYEILALDKKFGRTITIDDWKRIGNTPGAALTDDDINICGFFGGPSSAAAARARREKALAPPTPPESSATNTRRAAVPARVPVEFPDRLWDDNPADVREAIAQWSDTYAMKAVPVTLWHHFIVAARENREALEAKVATLADDLTAAKAQIAVLEAERLEPRVKALESRPAIHYAGVWQSDEYFTEGALLTYRGGLWLAEETTNRAPGTPASGFRLVVKSGGAL